MRDCSVLKFYVTSAMPFDLRNGHLEAHWHSSATWGIAT